ncbi:MAG: hypothetical protein HYY24_14755 [Verrucomicrobia bacterium]|nr:hypothetical protein [Verrucomicrobiota bacterium]
MLFENGDLLYGTLQSIDAQNGIRWLHPDAQGPIDFLPDHAREIQLRPQTQPSTPSSSACKVQLTNQDELEGDLVSVDAEKIVLTTWFGGELTIARSMAQVLIPIPAIRAPVFSGPTGLEDWTIGQVKTLGDRTGEWRYKNGAFYAAQAASIARDIKLPEVASLQFDLAWKGMLNLALALYTDYMQPISLANKETEPPFSAFYSMQINSFSVNLLPVKQDGPLKSLGQISVAAFSRKNDARIEIRVDKARRLVALMVDGVLVKQWVDPEDYTGKGTGIRLVHQGQGALKLSNLRVSEWDGQFEERPTNTPDSKHDLAKLRNGDRVAGDVQTIRDGKLAFATTGSTLAVPLSRVKQIELAGVKSTRPKAGPGDVRAFFPSGASVTFRLEKWDGQTVSGTSPSLGRVSFQTSAFARLQFNVHRLPKLDTLQ